MKKIFKCVILVILVIITLCLSVSAAFNGGSASTNRYFSPIDFNFEVFGITAELTPTISYASNMIGTTSVNESILATNSTVNVITRDNFDFSQTNSSVGVLNVSYKLSFDLTNSVDNFTIKVTAPDGFYNFVKYGIPQIKVPSGYIASYQLNYHMRYTLEQSFTDNTGTPVYVSNSVQSNFTIDLLEDDVIVNNTPYRIEGDVFIDNYSCQITFTKINVPVVGDSGFYLWDNVLSITEALDEYMGASPELHLVCDEDVYLYGNDNGVLTSLRVTEIFINEYDGWNETYLEYGLEPDQVVMAYSFGTHTWYGATQDDDGIVVEEITSEQMRMLHFTQPLEFTFIDQNPNITMDGVDVFTEFLLDNSIYYTESPLLAADSNIGTPYAFTDGDGGLYLRYYVDRQASAQFNNALTNLYQYGDGGNNSNQGNGFNYSWIGNTLKGVFDVPLFGFSLADVFGILLALVIAIAFLKVFAGG